MSFSVVDTSSFKVTPVSEVDLTHLRTAQKTVAPTINKDDQKPVPQPTQAEQAAKLASQGQTVYQIAAALGISVVQADLALGVQQAATNQRKTLNDQNQVKAESGQSERISLEA